MNINNNETKTNVAKWLVFYGKLPYLHNFHINTPKIKLDECGRQLICAMILLVCQITHLRAPYEYVKKKYSRNPKSTRKINT